MAALSSENVQKNIGNLWRGRALTIENGGRNIWLKRRKITTGLKPFA
jgi:hypothetical protein